MESKLEKPSFPLSSNKKQVINAIKWIQEPFAFELEHLTEKELKKIVLLTSGSGSFNVTFNCPLLTATLFYNLKMGKTELRAHNVYPIYKPITSLEVDEVLFGSSLFFKSISSNLNTIPDVADHIMDFFNNSGERVFYIYINLNYKIFGIPYGHCLNAVVLGQNDKARIVFADVWERDIYTIEELEKEYSGSNMTISLQFAPNEIPCLQKTPESPKKSFSFFKFVFFCPRPEKEDRIPEDADRIDLGYK